MSQQKTSQEAEADTSNQSAQREEEKELKLYFLMIDIINARDLIKADIGIGVSSDPFVTVTANGQSFSTKPIMNNLNPDFNEKTSFCFLEFVKEVHFQVWDWDKNTKHDEIGECTLDCSKFFDENNEGFKGSLKLLKVKSGTLNVNVTGRLVRPIELENRYKQFVIKKEENSKILEQKINKVGELTKENSILQTKQETLKEQQNTAELTVGQFEDTKSDLQSNIQSLKSKITETNTSIQKLKKQIEETQTKITNNDNQIADYEFKLKSKRSEKQDLVQEIETLRTM